MYNDPFGSEYGRQRLQEAIKAAEERHQINTLIKSQKHGRVRTALLSIAYILGL